MTRNTAERSSYKLKALVVSKHRDNCDDPIEDIGRRLLANSAAYPRKYSADSLKRSIESARELALFEEWDALKKLAATYQAETAAGALIQLSAAVDSAYLISENAKAAMERPIENALDNEQVVSAMNTVLRCLFSVAEWVEKRDGIDPENVGAVFEKVSHPDYRDPTH